MTKQDAYKKLGIKSDATPAEIKKAYRRRAMKCHPDRNPDDVKRATKEFQALQEAYKLLTESVNLMPTPDSRPAPARPRKKTRTQKKDAVEKARRAAEEARKASRKAAKELKRAQDVVAAKKALDEMYSFCEDIAGRPVPDELRRLCQHNHLTWPMQRKYRYLPHHFHMDQKFREEFSKLIWKCSLHALQPAVSSLRKHAKYGVTMAKRGIKAAQTMQEATPHHHDRAIFHVAEENARNILAAAEHTLLQTDFSRLQTGKAEIEARLSAANDTATALEAEAAALMGKARQVREKAESDVALLRKSLEIDPIWHYQLQNGSEFKHDGQVGWHYGTYGYGNRLDIAQKAASSTEYVAKRAEAEYAKALEDADESDD